MWRLIQEKQKTLNKIGLSIDSFDNVSVSNQVGSKPDSIPRCLNTDITDFDTLDISAYFKSPEKKNDRSKDDLCLFDDGMDDIFSNLDV